MTPFQPLPERLRAIDPHACALSAPEGRLTFGELNARADGFARALASRRFDRALPVAVCLERGLDLPVALLGILRAGHPFLGLDPRQPEARRRSLAAQACAVVAREGAWDLPVLPPGGAGEAPALELGPGDPAYLVHTSGSTGLPKLVEVGHGALAAYADAFGSALGLQPGLACLHVASFAYSAAVRQLFLPLAAGGTVVLASREEVLDPLALLERVRREGVGVLDWVPSYLRQVCEALERLAPERRPTLADLPCRLLLTSGEPLPWSLVRRWRALGFPGRLAHAYGLTETAGLVTWQDVGAEGDGLWVPLGRPLAHARLEVPPDGSEGPLRISGACLALAYRRGEGREPLAEPWDTGDRARLQADGTLVFAGRGDDQIKLHGIRVDLGEVEEALRACPGVAEAAVRAEADEVSHVRLAAFVVPATLEEAALRRALRERLPEALVPGSITALERLPRLLSGKVDRQALVPPRPSLDPPADPPRTESPEALVRRIWEETLGPEAGDGDFFELGGDSMQVIAMLGRINAALGREIPLVAAFFGDPTLQGLLAAVRAGLA